MRYTKPSVATVKKAVITSQQVKQTGCANRLLVAAIDQSLFSTRTPKCAHCCTVPERDLTAVKAVFLKSS
jgi:hypothetical protein